jgi:hypothetical protein
MLRKVLFVIYLSLAGCFSSTNMHRPGATPAQEAADRQACAQWVVANDHGWVTPASLMKRCLERMGYRESRLPKKLQIGKRAPNGLWLMITAGSHQLHS